MEYRRLGRAGIKVSPLCLGAMMFGRTSTREESIRIIHRALDAGINFIDTADVYGGPGNRGLSEQILGEALKGKRSPVVLATKVWGAVGDGPNDRGSSRRHILEMVERSLRNLQTDYIDLYQLHRPDPETPLEETLSALDQLVRQGKVRYQGVSEFPAWEMCEMLWKADIRGWEPIVSDQPLYNILYRGIERETAPFCQKHGIALIPFCPLASGMLSGKYRRGAKPPDDSRAAHSPEIMNRLSPELMDRIERLGALAQSLNIPLAQFGLAWLLRQPGVTAPIVGPRTMEQLEGCLGALDVQLPEAVLKETDAIVPPRENYYAYS